jgi:hypothetical protein
MSTRTSINVLRCALKNDQIVFIDSNYNGKQIIFQYGISIKENEKLNGILPNTYTNIYFYNYQMINPDGTISNFDTLIGTYYLLCETNLIGIQVIHLCQITSGNKLKMYSRYEGNTYSYLNILNKMVRIKINYDGEFSYANQQIFQSCYLPDIDMQPIEIINKYPIKMLNIPSIIDNNFEQEINFISNKINTDIYSIVYLDSDMTIAVNITNINNRYYLTFPQDIIFNNITQIYTKNINWLKKSLQINKKIKDLILLDPELDSYIDKKTFISTENIVYNILISKISKDKTNYKYKLVDNSIYNFTSSGKYTINNLWTLISSIDTNNNIITTNNFIAVL